jgi:hypothetical protein
MAEILGKPTGFKKKPSNPAKIVQDYRVDKTASYIG